MKVNSISLHRVIKANPEKVFRAFSDPAAYASWIPPYGFLCTVHHMDFKVGGSYKMSFTNFSTGHGHSFGGTFLEIEPNISIKNTDRFDDPNLPGPSILSPTIELEASAGPSAESAGVPVRRCRR
jgi:uncharacterized protein YndB with AHSA1/START domain